MSSHYLTFEELQYALEHEGLEVQERTIRFWIAKGVLEKPLRKPFKHADGRARYFPRKVVAEIMELLRLQEAGWKLKQIKSRLRAPVKVTQNELPTAEGMAKLLLSDYLNNGESRDKVRAFQAADPSTPQWRRLRNFLVARLSRFVGRKQAVRSVTSFMVGLSPRDVSKLLRRVEPGHEEDSHKVDSKHLTKALDKVVLPKWECPEPEPILSRRIRTVLQELRVAKGPEALELLGRLRTLRAALGESKKFLKPDA